MALEARKALADRTAEALRGAMREGVVPGGGVTLLSCRELLHEKMKTAQEDEERGAIRLLLKALEAPTRTLLENAGFDSYEWMPEINKAGPGFGFDTIRRKMVDMTTAGVYDSASVVKNALYSAIHSAALALTVDVLIHRKLPPESYATT
jgi:chaperonin GroEL